MGGSPRVLTAEQIAAFRSRGFLRVPQAMPPEPTLRMQAALWDELHTDHGIDREDVATWRQPRHGLRRAKCAPLNDDLIGPRFTGAISDLLGRDDWSRPSNWGGFLVTFPNARTPAPSVPSGDWHWDGNPRGDGLLVFSFFSEVEPGGGGTYILHRSHDLVARFYDSLSEEERARPHKAHRKMFFKSHPWLRVLQDGAGMGGDERVTTFAKRRTDIDGIDSQAVELTGSPGDAVFCSLGIVHSAAPNHAAVPRLMRVKFLALSPDSQPLT